MSADLAPAEALEAAAALAEVHRWAAVAWRHVASGSAPREAVLADLDDITGRIEQARSFLLKSGTTDVPEGR